jgi:glucose/arabinose dehydrogenase
VPISDQAGSEEFILGVSDYINNDWIKYYYAYGIRNSFGIDFDPVTGNLWDTENGPSYGDEINLVKPGFNSGWRQIQGIWEVESGLGFGSSDNAPNVADQSRIDSLFDFNGKGHYAPPEFAWKYPVAPTAIKFFSSPNFGTEYQNDFFVGDVNTGSMYRFKLDVQRAHLMLDNALSDKVADSNTELDDIKFGDGFGVITDIKQGPDGNLYVLSFSDNDSKIYKISK